MAKSDGDGICAPQRDGAVEAVFGSSCQFRRVGEPPFIVELPDGANYFNQSLNDLIKLFQEYFGSKQSAVSRLAELFSVEQRPGETVQAFQLRVQKDMRICSLTSNRSAEDLLGVVGVHLFARGLSSASARKSVLEHDAQDLSSAAAKAQAVVLAVGIFDGNLSYQGRETTETIFVVVDAQCTVPALLEEQASIRLGLLAMSISATDIPAGAQRPASLPPHAWHTVAIDVLYKQQSTFLTLLDLYSRYPAVVRLPAEKTSDIIGALDQIFTLFGMPTHLIADNRSAATNSANSWSHGESVTSALSRTRRSSIHLSVSTRH